MKIVWCSLDTDTIFETEQEAFDSGEDFYKAEQDDNGTLRSLE